MKIKAAPCAGLAGGLDWASPGTERVELEQLFPLPTIVPPKCHQSLGGHARARHRIRRHFVGEANSAIDALNWYAGSRAGREVKTHEELTPLQQQVTARVEGLVEAMHDSTIAIPAPQAAFSELLRGRSCYDEQPSAGLNVARYTTAENISLPASLNGAPFLDEILPTSLHQYLGDAMERMLKTTDELEMGEEIRAHWDQRLASHRPAYVRLMRYLIRLGIVMPVKAGSAREQLGLFFVKKSGKDKVRLIVDARRVNRRFRAPPSVTLASSEALSRIEIELPADVDFDSDEGRRVLENLEIYLGNGDVKDAFHRFRLRRDFALWFGVGSASTGEMRLVGQRVDGEIVGFHDTLDLVWTSLPMGFSWSLFFCQHVIQDVACKALDQSRSLLMADRSPPAVFRVGADGTPDVDSSRAHYVYVDNLGLCGCEKKEVESDLGVVVTALESKGLLTHELSVDTTASPLGVVFDGKKHFTVLTAKRYWRVCQAAKFALSRRAVPGWVWEVLLGHFTFCGLVRRDLLSGFHTIYKFIRHHYNQRVPLWPSAREEVLHFAGALVFARTELGLQRSPHVTATDASLYGFGICTARWPRGEVAKAGRVLERSRFKAVLPGEKPGARESFFAANAEHFDLTTLDLPDSTTLREDPDFPELDASLLTKDLFTPQAAGRFYRPEDILVLEARALTRGLEVSVSVAKLQNARVLFLVDNMSVCASYETSCQELSRVDTDQEASSIQLCTQFAVPLQMDCLRGQRGR